MGEAGKGGKGGGERVVQLTDKVVGGMGVGKVFKDSQGKINSLDFHRVEDLMVAAGDDDSMHVYDISVRFGPFPPRKITAPSPASAAPGTDAAAASQTGLAIKHLHSKKYGVGSVRFTHHPNALIYASKPKGAVPAGQAAQAHALRYLSMHNDSFLRYFVGHTAPVLDIGLSPVSDLFASSSADRSVKLWDLRTSACQMQLEVEHVPCAAFDMEGLVFAVGLEGGVIKMFDAKAISKGPFSSFMVPAESSRQGNFSQIKFAPDGEHLIAVAENRVYIVHAFEGLVEGQFDTGSPAGRPALGVGWSADGQYIASGCADKTVKIWNLATCLANPGKTPNPVATWKHHAEVPEVLAWAPRRAMVASACHALSLWVPQPAQG